MFVKIENTMNIKVKDEIYEVPDYMEVRDGKLWNNNTKRYEGVDGDKAKITGYGRERVVTVKQYTEYQIIPNYESNTIIISAVGLHNGDEVLEYIHNTEVQEV